jgi:hypothetical protein
MILKAYKRRSKNKIRTYCLNSILQEPLRLSNPQQGLGLYPHLDKVICILFTQPSKIGLQSKMVPVRNSILRIRGPLIKEITLIKKFFQGRCQFFQKTVVRIKKSGRGPSRA